MGRQDGSHEQGEAATAVSTATPDTTARGTTTPETESHGTAGRAAAARDHRTPESAAAESAAAESTVQEEEGEGAQSDGGGAEEPETQRPGVAVSATGFGLEGPRGEVFTDITFELPAGSLGAVEGASGTGRTCLLLALTGRMKAGSGQARVGRSRLPKQMAAVRRVAALGPAPGITDLDPSLSVAEHLRERVLLQQRFGDSLRGLFRPRGERAAARRKRLNSALEAAGLDPESLPKGPRTRVRDLERMESLRLGIALAMLAEPRLLAVDDLDLKLSDAEREEAWALLRSLAEAGTTVLAVCAQAPADAVVIRTGAERGREGQTGSSERDETPPHTAPAKRTRHTERKRRGRSGRSTGHAGHGTEPGKQHEQHEQRTKGEAADALA